MYVTRSSLCGLVASVPIWSQAFHATFQTKSSWEPLPLDSPELEHFVVVDKTSWNAFSEASETLRYWKQ